MHADLNLKRRASEKFDSIDDKLLFHLPQAMSYIVHSSTFGFNIEVLASSSDVTTSFNNLMLHLFTIFPQHQKLLRWKRNSSSHPLPLLECKFSDRLSDKCLPLLIARIEWTDSGSACIHQY
jgi:hypothetical protein